jgi:hypothetical protein
MIKNMHSTAKPPNTSLNRNSTIKNMALTENLDTFADVVKSIRQFT